MHFYLWRLLESSGYFQPIVFMMFSDNVMAWGILLRVTINIWPFYDFQVIFFPFRLKKAFERYLCFLEAKSAENLIFFFPFLWCCANVGVVSREIREPPTYLSSKNKKIRDRVDSRVQLVWRLQVMGSCYNQSVWNAGNQSFSHSFCLKWRTSNFCVIQDDGEHVDFFRRKPTSI